MSALGFTPFGWAAFGTLPDMTIPPPIAQPIPPQPFAITGPEAIYAIEVFAPAGGARVIAAATREYATWPLDLVSNWPFHGNVQKSLSFNRGIVSQSFGKLAAGFGELELLNDG